MMLKRINTYNQIYRLAAFLPFVLATLGLLDFIRKFQFLQNNFIDGSFLGFLAGVILLNFIWGSLKKHIGIDFLAMFFLSMKVLELFINFLRSNFNEFSWHYALIVLLCFFIYLLVIINHIRYWDYYVE